MSRIFGRPNPFFALRRVADASKRRSWAPRLDLETLEGRIALSSIVHNPAYDSYDYQPLNGDTQYCTPTPSTTAATRPITPSS